MASLQTLLKTLLLTSLVFTVPVVGVRVLGGFETAELAAYDDFVRRRPAETVDDRVVIVTIGDDDIEALQQYPIHDGTLAQALETLESYRPRAIGLDVARDVPQGAAAGRQRLTQVISKSELIVAGCLLSTETHAGAPPAPGTPPEAAAFTEFPQDQDKTVRRVLLLSTPAKSAKRPRVKHICNDARVENELPSLSFQLAQAFLSAANLKPDLTATNELQIGRSLLWRIDNRFGGYANADVNDYQMMLNYRAAKQAFRQIPILEVLRNQVDPQKIRDRVVLIGYISAVSKDVFSTPYAETEQGDRTMAGVVVHAQAVSQILSTVQNQRPLLQSWSDLGESVWIWIWALGSGLVAFYNRHLGLFLVGTIATGIALWGICYALFLFLGLWVPFVPTLVAAMLTAVAVRAIELANRSGYAQAIYQQLREQFQGGGGGRDRQGAYLEHLVHRARAVRQGEAATELLATGAEPTAATTPEMQALYDQIAAKVRADLATEQVVRPVAIAPSRSNRANRIQSLLHRAQTSRNPRSPIQTPPTTQPPETPCDATKMSNKSLERTD